MVAAALSEAPDAAVPATLRATLTLLARATRSREAVTADDVRAALEAGVTPAQVRDALRVAFCFNVINRLADTFAFRVGADEEFAASARMLIARGYKL